MDIAINASHVFTDSMTTLNMVLSERLHLDGNGFGLPKAHEHIAVFLSMGLVAVTPLEQWVSVGPTLHSSSSIPLGLDTQEPCDVDVPVGGKLQKPDAHSTLVLQGSVS